MQLVLGSFAIYVRMLYLDFRNVYCNVRCANTVTVHIKSLKFLFVKKEFKKKTRNKMNIDSILLYCLKMSSIVPQDLWPSAS